MESHSAGDARPRFSLGQIVATPGALDLLDRHAVNAADVLHRHESGDWGDLCPDDAASNEEAIRVGLRLISCYAVGHGESIWIITEADRSVTTLLLPAEY